MRRHNAGMASIDIRHAHSLPAAGARAAVEEVAAKLGRKFGLQYRWEGDTLHFLRPGVDGRIELLPRQLHVSARLGLLFSAMKGPIEAEIRRYLDERFGNG
jgi:putative polyhydroxyalkanoate system protein